MPGVNKVTLIGNLGADPEMYFVGANKDTAVATFNIAVNRSWKDSNGNKQEHTEWVRVVTWRKLAEIVAQYLEKGSQAYIEGRLQTRTWDDENGNRKYMTEVVAHDIQFLSRPSNSNGGDNAFSEADIPPDMGDGDLPF